MVSVPKTVEKEKLNKKSPKSKPKKLILLDSQAIIHRAYHALPDFASSKGEPTGALYGLCTMLIKIITDLKPDYIVACFDMAEKTYRHEAYENYKAGRKKADDALVSQLIRAKDIFKAFNIPIYEKAGFEADDILGTIVAKVCSSKEQKEKVDIIIASGDMDTLQLVNDRKVMVYTLKKGINDTILYDEKAVVDRFGFVPSLLPDYKGLRGDPSDNIIGVPGIGDKTACQLVWAFGSIENIYKILEKKPQLFEKAAIKPRIVELLKTHKEEAEFSKMLASIRMDAPINFSLPEKTWRDGLELKPIVDLFADLEFRTLGARVKEAFNLTSGVGAVEGVEAEEKMNQTSLTLQTVVDQKRLKETAIALWLVHSSMTSPKLEDILQYSRTEDFEQARLKILSEIEKQGLKKVYESIELPLMAVTEAMEKHGVKIDKKWLSELSKKYHIELDALQSKIWNMAGEQFNINSPKQMAVVLFEKMKLTAKGLKKTDGGVPSTRESELLKLSDSHPIVQEILQYREIQKLLSTYIDNLPLMLDENDRLHTTYSQAGTTTGRLSSVNPNLQNIPNKTPTGRAIREAFIAPPGNSLLVFDYSQIELRIAAFLSGDKKMIEIFKNGEDVHAAVASEVFKVPLDKVDKEMRRKAKVINFGIIYGMGINALKANLKSDREEAQRFYNQYFENFKTLADYLEKVKQFASKNGYTETLFGRKRQFEGINSKIHFIKAAAERMAINAPIQGTGADIIKMAAISVFNFLQKENLLEKVFPVLQVHDELVFEVPNNLVKDLAPKIKNIMENVVDRQLRKDVPIVADVSVGANWGDLKKI